MYLAPRLTGKSDIRLRLWCDTIAVMQKPRISIVVAIGSNSRAIGKENKLLWHIPEDLKRFKALTLGHPVIMGRKTFDSIVAMLGKPLPERTNIVVTRDTEWKAEGVVVAHTILEAIEKARALDAEEICIIGGAQIYEQALPYANTLHLTRVEDAAEGDTFFPPFEHLFTKKVSEEKHEHNGLQYSWVTLERE